jgi:L-lactate dehydrogenase complex protein LldG
LDILQRKGVKIQHEAHPDIRVGLTGSIAGIAETGSLVIPSGVGRPQTASLLPEIHLAILHEKDIYANLAMILRLNEIFEKSAVTLVSGPSRTADIEMTLTIGVHGPGELHVFCLERTS